MNPLPNLLIVDDNEENLFLLEAITKVMDVTIIRALSGAEALEKIRNTELALAILDVRMPEMNGYDLAIKLNEERSGDKVPVIFVTAVQISETDTFRGYESGAVDYISKPFNTYILRSKIRVFLDLFKQKQIIARDAELLRKSAEVLAIAHEANKKTEEKYRNFFELTADLVVIAELDGSFKEINNSWLKILGYTREELLGKPYMNFIHPDDLDKTKQIILDKLVRGDIVMNFENRYLKKDGEVVWMEWTSRPNATNDEQFAIARDITERKKTEAELKNSLEQLHLLMQYNEKVRENERVAISRELHDELGQALTAIKIDLGIISRGISDQEMVAKVNKVSSFVRDTIKTVQRLTSQLRPQIIDDLGLAAATEWYSEEFAQRTGIGISLDLDPGLTILPDASLVIFRILQESLTNIARHSGATHAEIKLRKSPDHLHLRIVDNGIGIPEDESKSSKSFGIISMKERAASLGGTFDIGLDESGGTLAELILPLNLESHENIDL